MPSMPARGDPTARSPRPAAALSHRAAPTPAPAPLAQPSAARPAEAGNEALRVLDELGIPSEDVVLVDLDRVGPTTDANEPLVLIWEDVIGQGREEQRGA